MDSNLIQLVDYEKNENHRTSLENHDNHESIIIPLKKNENHRIPH